jgi:hypothetical protein
VGVAKSRCTHSLFSFSATDLYPVMTVARGGYPTNVGMKHQSKYSEIIGGPFAKMPAEVCQIWQSALTRMGV